MAAERREGSLCSAHALSDFLSLQSAAGRARRVKAKDTSGDDGRMEAGREAIRSRRHTI